MLGTSIVIYVLVEATVRIFYLPDPQMIYDMTDQYKLAGSPEEFYSRDYPAYGWNSEPFIFETKDSSGDDPGATILFVGDSITHGQFVDPESDSYPALLFEQLSSNQAQGTNQTPDQRRICQKSRLWCRKIFLSIHL